MVISQTEAQVLFTCDKTIPSYYVLSDKGNAFCRNEKVDGVTNKLRELLKLNDDTTLGLVDTLTDIAGGFHETYQQYYKGVEVDGKRCSVHYTCDGMARMVNGNLWTVEGIDVFPAKKNGEAKNLAIEAIRIEFQKEERESSTDIWKSINIDSVVLFKQAKLVVYVKKDIPHLAYKYLLNSSILELNQCVYIDANNGNVLDIHSTICSITTTAQSVYSNTVPIETEYSSGTYRLRDTTRGNGIETKAFLGAPYAYNQYGYDYAGSYGNYYTSSDNTWTNLSNNDRAAIDVHWGIEKTYDFYLNKFGRNSYDNNGSNITSYVNTKTILGNYLVNAAWTGSNFVFGRNDDWPIVSLDITAHELTHGVTNSTSNLYYTNESGAINEGLSDVFGVSVEKEYKPNNPDSLIWKIGEEPYTGGLRDISLPNCKYYHGTNWKPTVSDPSDNNDYGWVHNNSGVFNYWFYLLVHGENNINEGGFHYTVDSIGFEKAIQICYLANAAYLRTNHQYIDARYCTLYAAHALNYDANVINQVGNAWDAVGVYEGIVGSGIIYNSAVYRVAAVPDSCSVNWSLNGANAPNFTLQSDTPSTNQCRLVRDDNAEFSGSTSLILTAQVLYSGTVIESLTKHLTAPYIDGPTVPCDHAVYSVVSRPENSTVAWETNGHGLGYDLDPNGLLPEDATAHVIIPSDGEDIWGTLTANVIVDGDTVGVLSKYIDSSGGFFGTWYQEPTSLDSTNAVPQGFSHMSLLEMVSNRKVYLVSDDFIDATITHSQNGVLVRNWSNSNGVISFTPWASIGDGVGMVTVNGSYPNSCRHFRFFLTLPQQPLPPLLLSASPSGGAWQFALSEREGAERSADLRTALPTDWQLTVIKSDTGQAVYDGHVSGTSATVSSVGWLPGVYVAVAFVDGQYFSSKFVVSK